MKRLLIPAALLILFGFIGGNRLLSQEAGKEDQMMQAMMKYGTPGEFHKKLEPMVGSWQLTTKWWADPSAEPQESKATAEAKWILGGRFVQEDVTGEMMGQPFHGLGFCGYDNFRGEYISLWMDEMSTPVMVMKGQSNQDGKTITFNGTYDDIMTGQRDKKYKIVTKIIDNDHRLYLAYDNAPDGKEFMSMEINYARKK